MAEENTIASESVFKGRAVNLRIDTVETTDGRHTTREVVEHAECVVIIPVDRDGNVLMEKQYRHAIGKVLLEIPAGGIEPGESPADAVRREMAEETGFAPETVTGLGGFYSSPGFCTEYLHLFLATDLVPNRLTAEDTDEIEVVRTPVSDIGRLIDSGAIVDSKSIAGLCKYLRRVTVPGQDGG